jgi:hypothetical protein
MRVEVRSDRVLQRGEEERRRLGLRAFVRFVSLGPPGAPRRAQVVDVRVVGASMVLAGWALGGRPLPHRSRAAFVFLLLVLVAAMVRGGDFGGRLVYDYNAGGNACGQPIEFTR